MAELDADRLRARRFLLLLAAGQRKLAEREQAREEIKEQVRRVHEVHERGASKGELSEHLKLLEQKIGYLFSREGDLDVIQRRDAKILLRIEQRIDHIEKRIAEAEHQQSNLTKQKIKRIQEISKNVDKVRARLSHYAKKKRR